MIRNTVDTTLELYERCLSKKEIICFVGGGGKTTTMYELAEFAAARGRRVLVSTTTHILKPAAQYAKTAEEALALWEQGRFAVIGTPEETGRIIKLTAPAEHLYQELASQADLILLEADGAKGHPCKVPAEHEPVIPEACTMVVGVFGMTALGKPVQDVCFRFSKCGAWTEWAPETIMDEEAAAKLLSSTLGTRKNVGDRPYIVLINQCDDEQTVRRAERIAHLLRNRSIYETTLRTNQKI